MSQEHNTGAARVRFGTLDWRHAEWRESYYPEDLPEDWQLGYYANEVGAVLLEPEGWLAGPPEDLAAWAEEVHEDFRFYLLLDPAREVADQRARAAVLGDRLGGLLWPGEAALPGVLGSLAADRAAGLPAGVSAWGDEAGIRLATIDVAGLDLRARRGVLERLAPALAGGGEVALILVGQAVQPTQARELQTVAELMGIA